MDIFENLKTRFSVRNYADRPVARETVERCVEGALLSPSACNSQPWKFVVVDDPALKEQMVPLLKNDLFKINTFTAKTPCFVVIVNEFRNITSRIGELLKDKNYSDFDIGMAAQSFCLCANELGLGTCIMGWFDEKRLKKLLHVPERKRIALVIACGYPENDPPKKSRKSLPEAMSRNGYTEGE